MWRRKHRSTTPPSVDTAQKHLAVGDIDEDVQSLVQFSTELTVEAVARCIKTINANSDVPHKLPPSMSARFQIGSKLANALQDLGYRGDVGYQTFLYSNEADLRRVFLFLLEKLPKESSETEDELLGASALLQREIASKIKLCLSRPWLPPFCKLRSTKWQPTQSQWLIDDLHSMHHFHSCSINYPKQVPDVSQKIPKDVREYYNKMPFVHSQPPQYYQLPSALIETNAKQVTSQHEWDTEWNNMGLPSRLTPEEYKSRKRQKITKNIVECLMKSKKGFSDQMEGVQDLSHLLQTLECRTASLPNIKGSRFTHTQKLQFAQDDDKTVAQVSIEGLKPGREEEQQQKQEEEIEKLKADLLEVTTKLEALQFNVKKMKANLNQSEEKVTNFDGKVKEKKEAYLIKKKAMELLPNAEENIEKLQELVDSSAQRLVKLANQWEKHRAPLIAQYRELKELVDHKQDDGTVKTLNKMLKYYQMLQGEVEERLAAIQEIREKIKTSATEARSKDDLLRQLHTEYESMVKDVNRSAYTKRILEIVSNIAKQKQQIDQVLLDTKSLQKDINRLSGKLDRTFTVTDELIFKDAKKDETIRKAYKYLASLHQNCTAIIQTVEETGVILREIRDLEDQVEQERKRNIQENLSKITADFKAIKTENSALIAKLKKASLS
ncbi:hypothetical protein LSH36_40g21002 [Paralvinella palmiformis]|uniref:Coiled-coil domain-containing protein 22 homolog n=1 Tax=Paralvinella palmiformis TaxID=53620 RepID=A0AAD9K8A9_9ANNE|nr:hypothetical protein LSH36_40g21002 [Paralvinella palmiformis]